MNNFKNIHIGQMIKKKVTENGMAISRICNFIKCTEKEITDMYTSKSMDTELLLRWSKLLEYDFFRLYSQHLILYAPQGKSLNQSKSKEKIISALPQFRKNIYTKELIDFILEMISKGEKSRIQVVEEYGIPKTTLYKWIDKYSIR